MADVQIKLSLIWVALMLSYLLGDVLRIFSGDATSGKMGHDGELPLRRAKLVASFHHSV